MMTNDSRSTSNAPKPVVEYHGPRSGPAAPPPADRSVLDDPAESLHGESRLGWGMQLLCVAIAAGAFLLIWLTHRLTVT